MFTNSLFSIVTGLALLFVVLMDLTGCSSGGGSNAAGGGPVDEIIGASTIDTRVAIQSNFSLVEEVKEVPSSFYTRGCKKQNSMQNDQGYDSALRPNHVFREIRMSSTNAGIWKTEVETRLRQVEKMTMVTEETFVNFSLPGQEKMTEQPFIKTPHFVVRHTLTKSEGSDYYRDERENIESGLNPEWIKQRNSLPAPKEFDCEIKRDGEVKSEHKEIIRVGTIRLLDRNLKAIEQVSITKGQVVCRENKKDAPEINLGLGTQEWVQIRSNQVLGLMTNYCGGHQLYWGFALKLENGRVINSYASRVDSAPLAR